MMITLMLIAATAIVSLAKMHDQSFTARFMFNAYAISKHREWWRFFSHGLLHANFIHLFFNMLALYFFGRNIEIVFIALLGKGLGAVMYLLMYTSSLFASSIASFFKHRDNMYYNALGASGAVAAVIFASILIDPKGTIYIYAFPVPAWLFGVLYLGYSFYMSKRGADNIGHDAHFWGAVYGFVFPLVVEPRLFQLFLFQLESPSLN